MSVYPWPQKEKREMEKSDLVRGLREIDPSKPYGTELFDALARLTVSVAVEAVCLRWNPGTTKIEVYMIQRAPDDTAYPGQWHCPGSVMRPGEEFKDALNRLEKKELGGNIASAQFVCLVNHPTEARGHFLSLVYSCILKDARTLRGKWFPVDQLPEKTVDCHRVRIIPAAAGAFAAESTGISA